MSQNYYYPPTEATISGPIVITGVATADNQTNGAQKTQIVDASDVEIGGAIKTDLDALNARTAGALVPTAFDEVDLTYIVGGNGDGQVGTAVYKLATVTQASLTLTYDSSNRLASVVKS